MDQCPVPLTKASINLLLLSPLLSLTVHRWAGQALTIDSRIVAGAPPRVTIPDAKSHSGPRRRQAKIAGIIAVTNRMIFSTF